MKLEARFTSKNNKLFKIADDSEVSLSSLMRIEAAVICGKELEEGAFKKMTSEFTATKNKLLCVYLPWFLVEPELESYNEELLATLRDFLKEIEESGLDAVIVPQAEADSCPVQLEINGELNVRNLEYFIAAMKHTARRIKDCVSVIGFAIPKELLSESFEEDCAVCKYIEELSQKHAHYVYFAKKEDVDAAGLTQAAEKTSVVLY